MGRHTPRSQNELGQALTELLFGLLILLGFFFFAYAASEELEKSQRPHRFKTERSIR